MEDSSGLGSSISARSPAALIGIIPGILGILALLAVLLAYREDIRRAIPTLSGVEAFGFKVSLLDVRSWAADASRKLKELDIAVTDADLKAALARAEDAGRAYRDSMILWVDDHPENNRLERRAFTVLGSHVTVAVSNEEAFDRLSRADFDVVISDLTRDNSEDAREVAWSFASGSTCPVDRLRQQPRIDSIARASSHCPPYGPQTAFGNRLAESGGPVRRDGSESMNLKWPSMHCS
jgi:CheY-like chemotaxis protein